MEDRRSKKPSDGNREKHGGPSKKKNFQEKKTRSDTTTYSSCSSLTDASLESIVVIGKSLNFTKSRSHESGYHLHECLSEVSIFPVPGSESVAQNAHIEGGECIAPSSNFSNSSFISAKSDISSSNQLTKKGNDIENEIYKSNAAKQDWKKLEQSKYYKSESIETDSTFNSEDYSTKLKNLEKEVRAKEKKILELNHKFRECSLARNLHMEENKSLAHRVNLLNRQLQSMYELIIEKKWNRSADVSEIMEYNKKNIELEMIIAKQQEEKLKLNKKLEKISINLELKEEEVNSKNRELLDYKNQTALEISKLTNQIDCLKRNMRTQTQFFDDKFNDAQNSMDDEIVKITTKLEEQYQKDLKVAIEKLQSDFETLSALPGDILEKFIRFTGSNKGDFPTENKKESQKILESKITEIQGNYDKEIKYLKDSYETKLIFLKTQVETLSSQLQERKEIIDVFESELMAYKTNSAMNLLRASSIANDVTSLKELYAAEIFSQKQIHKLEIDVFEEKVRNLSEEILYRAENEEIRSHELESAKKMALTYREKYEHLVFEWEERVEREFKIISSGRTENVTLDNMFDEFNDLINSLKEAEKVHEDRIRKLQSFHEDEITSYKRDIEIFKTKISQLEVFQKAQAKLDNTIQDLIKSVGSNYIKTVDALVTSHVAEQSLKDLEIYTAKKKHCDEIESVKNEYKKEITDLQNKLQITEESKKVLEGEINSLRTNCGCDELKLLKNKLEEISVKLLKCEGIIATKEEAEKILNERIRELEGMIKMKEENCRKELEDLVAKLVEVNILSSAKDDLAAELESKLNESEKRLEKSNHNMNQLYEVCSLMEENLKKVDGNITVIQDFKKNAKFAVNYSTLQTNCEELNSTGIPNYTKINFSEKEENWSKEKEKLKERNAEEEVAEQNKKLVANFYLLMQERNQYREKTEQLKKENAILLEKLAAMNLMVANVEKVKHDDAQMTENTPHSESEQLAQKELSSLKAEKKAFLVREEELTVERNEIVLQNKALEKNVEDLQKNVDVLTTEIRNFKESEEDSTFSISLQEVRVFYEEENVSEVRKSVSATSVGCQTELLDHNYEDLVKENQKLKEEKEMLSKYEKEVSSVTDERNHWISKSEKMEKETVSLAKTIKALQEKNESLLSDVQKLKEEKTNLIEELERLKQMNGDIESNLENVEKEKSCLIIEIEDFQKKISQMSYELEEISSDSEKLNVENKKLQEEVKFLKGETYELQKLRSSVEKLENDKKKLIKEIESLKEENFVMATSYEAKMKIIEHKVSSASEEKDALRESEINDMRREIENLNELIKNMSTKLKFLKTSNENLVNEKNTQVVHNQNLMKELEDAWEQRYEIEDQLSRVRKENALLNIYRTQLEDTNKKISNLLSEGKTSAVSWVKIHETVESIMDEMLALKTSLGESLSPICTPVEAATPKTTSELKLMTENLQAQLMNKSILCDELAIHNKALENELKDLEELLKQNDSRILKQWRIGGKSYDEVKSKMDDFTNQSDECPRKNPSNATFDIIRENENFMENESEENYLSKPYSLEAALNKNEGEIVFEDSLELENSGSKMGRLQEDIIPKKNIKENACNSPGETQHDDNRKLAIEVEDLVNAQGAVEECTKNYAEEEVEKLRLQLETCEINFEEAYQDLYKQFETELPSALENELKEIISSFFKKFKEEKSGENQLFMLEDFLKNIFNKFVQEVKLLQNNYRLGLHDLKIKYSVDLENTQAVINDLRNNFKKMEEEIAIKQKSYLEGIVSEYENQLKIEKQRLHDILEDIKQKHKKEILEKEDFWIDKLSECETKCALIKAKKPLKENEKGEESTTQKDSKKRKDCNTVSDQISSAKNTLTESCSEELPVITELKKTNDISTNTTTNFEAIKSDCCSSCVGNQSYFKKMEVDTDDDKLEILRERDFLKEMVSSLKFTVMKLLSFLGQQKKDLNNTSLKYFEGEDTLYQSIQVDPDQSLADLSVASNVTRHALDLSTIIQEINDHSLLNSSNQVREELDKCLDMVKKDAAGLLVLSNPKNFGQFNELIKKIQSDKTELEKKISKVEEIQMEMKEEVSATKEKLSVWERNLEVISESYGEEVAEPQKVISLVELKGKLKLFMTEKCAQPSQEMHILEEICKEGDRLQEEWKREKIDLQQQIEVADKQLNSLKKFLEEQASEREQEREAFDKEINTLKETLKAKERENTLQSRTNRDDEHPSENAFSNPWVEALEAQIKDLSNQINGLEKNKKAIESEFQNAVKKIWSLREVIQDLEVQLAETSERECSLKKKAEKLDLFIDEQSRLIAKLKEELEIGRNENEVKYSEHVKMLEEEIIGLRRSVEHFNPETLSRMKSNLREIEEMVVKKTKNLEMMHMPSCNVSCSSPSEDVSIRDHLDATRCSTPDEMTANLPSKQELALPLEEIDRLHEKLERHTRAEEVASKFICDLKMQLKNNKKTLEEFQTEREIFLERVDQYLKENSSLKARLEEQRCNATLLQKQLNADLESQINRLEIDVEKLNDLCHQKDNQLQNMKEILENTTKALKIREAEVLSKSKEENSLVSNLKTDLANALNEKEKLEESLEKVKNKLRDSLKMPALIDSMLEEKNAEIDRLEKEVSRLSEEKSNLEVSLKKCDEEFKSIKNGKKIKFSEPESFGDCISSISPYSPSILRNCNDSFGDFRNSSIKLRQQVQSFVKPESLSSIGPLQLSPRGTDSYNNWKTSSPIFEKDNSSKNIIPVVPPKADKSFEKMAEESKLHQEVELKQREISELKLEIDVMKRQLIELNQELQTIKSEKREIQIESDARNEELQKVKNNERSLLMTLESLKKYYAEEVDGLQNKLKFEKSKVERVSEEIKMMEVKKIEIEEAFYSLKEDYNEKLKAEQNTVETLIEKIKDLEWKNCEAEKRFECLKLELENVLKESKEIADFASGRFESDKDDLHDLESKNSKMSRRTLELENAEVQVDGGWCFNCRNEMNVKIPDITNISSPLKNSLDKLKIEVDETISNFMENEFSQKEAVSCLINIKNILLLIFNDMNEVFQELNAYRRKVMESSVDELAVKVRKELLLSAQLDNDLLSSIEAKGFPSKTTNLEPPCDMHHMGDGDNSSLAFQQNLSMRMEDIENVSKALEMYRESIQKIRDLDSEKLKLEEKLEEQQKIIKFLEENLLNEKDRIIKEKERCYEDAKIMELLRVNLEKSLQDLKAKEKENKKERQRRLSLEKEITTLKKQLTNIPGDSRKVNDLNCQLEAQKEKIISLGKLLEDEQRKNQELKLSLEQIKLERKSGKESYKLLEADLNMLKEQKETLKAELIAIKQLVNSRDMEIGLLKRKINLQEIDIKALTLTSDLNRPSFSEVSSIASRGDILENITERRSRRNLENDFLNGEDSNNLAFKMQQLNNCVQRHVQESNSMGEALLHLSEETERMRNLLKDLEKENCDVGLENENSVRDGNNIETKLWNLEKGRLLMDLEMLKNECELTKRESLETCKTNEYLKRQNSKLKAEIEMLEKEATKEIDNAVLKDRITHLTGKYMRAESYRKALIWQKRYLTITLNEYQRSEVEAWKRLEKFGSKKKDGKPRKRPCRKFKPVVLAVVAIFRMKFIVKRWHSQKVSSLSSCTGNKNQQFKNNALVSVLSIYNEPVNPLSYQTHNIFRRSSTVLRSPPSRDPGFQKYSLDGKKGSECLQSLNFL